MARLTIQQVQEIEERQIGALFTLFDAQEDISIYRVYDNTFDLIHTSSGLVMGHFVGSLDFNGVVRFSFTPSKRFRDYASKRRWKFNVLDLSQEAIASRTQDFVNWISSLKREYGL